jgi:high-affinity Fe2+/Pb2+ permease
MLFILCLPTTVASSFVGGTFGVQIATAQTAQIVSQASLGAMTAPFIGIMVAALGGALGTLGTYK